MRFQRTRNFRLLHLNSPKVLKVLALVTSNTITILFQTSWWAKRTWNGNFCEIKISSHYSHFLTTKFIKCFSIQVPWSKALVFTLNFRRAGRGWPFSAFVKPSLNVQGLLPPPSPGLPLHLLFITSTLTQITLH